MKSRRTKALDIPHYVKQKVWDRDGGRCILCGNPNAAPNAHFLSRAHSGRGIEQNIVTLCQECHHDFDNTTKRKALKIIIGQYLKRHYPDFPDEERIYKK